MKQRVQPHSKQVSKRPLQKISPLWEVCNVTHRVGFWDSISIRCEAGTPARLLGFIRNTLCQSQCCLLIDIGKRKYQLDRFHPHTESTSSACHAISHGIDMFSQCFLVSRSLRHCSKRLAYIRKDETAYQPLYCSIAGQ